MCVCRQFQSAFQNGGRRAGPKAAIEERARPIGDHFRGIEIVFRTEAVTGRASAIRRIETKRTRLKLRNADAAIGACQLFRKRKFFSAHYGNRYQTRSELQRRRDGLLKPRRNSLLDEQPIDHDFNGVIFSFVELGRIIERKKFTVNAHADIAVLRKLFEFLAIRAFAAAHDGRENHHAIIGLADLPGEDGVHDRFARLPFDGLRAIRAMRNSYRRKHHPQIIVNFGNGAHRGAWGPRRGLLFDGNRRR